MLEKLQKLKNHQGFRRYFSNTSWLFGEKILRMFVGLFVGVWVARYLGPEQFGLLSYLFAFTALFGFLVRLGFDGGLVVKELKAQSDNGKVMATTFFLKFLGAILAVLSISIVIRFVESDPFTIVLMSLIGLTYFFRAFSVFDLYFQSLVLSKYTVIANAIALFSIAGVKVILILLKAPLIAFVYGALAESAIAAFIYLYFYMRLSRSGGKWKVDLTYACTVMANYDIGIFNFYLYADRHDYDKKYSGRQCGRLLCCGYKNKFALLLHSGSNILIFFSSDFECKKKKSKIVLRPNWLPI